MHNMTDEKIRRIGVYVDSPGSGIVKRLRFEAKKRNVKLDELVYSDIHIAVKPPKKFIIYLKDEKYILPKVVINRLAASTPGLAILLLSHFEKSQKSKIINRSLRTSIARDKFRVMQCLASKGFQVPATVLLGSTKERDLKWAVKVVGGFPAILKLTRGLQGVGVLLIDNMSALRATYDLIKKIRKPMVLQQYISAEAGTDYRFYVVGDEVAAAMKRIAQRRDEFRANIHRGGKGEKYLANNAEKRLALAVARALGLEVCGIDFIRTEEGLMPIEVNLNAGFKGIEKATGVNVAGKIIDYCIQELNRFEAKKARRRIRSKKKP